MAKNRLNGLVVNTASILGEAAGAFQKARDSMLKKPDFIAGMSASSQWSGGTLSNPEQAQMRAARNNWFYTGVNLRALDLSASKMDIYNNPGGLEDEGERAEAHPFLKTLRRPNPYMGKSLLLQYTEWWMDLQGEAFWFIEPEIGGKGIKGIWPIPSNVMDIEFTDDGKHIKRYVLKLQQWYFIDPNYIVHFKYPNPWDFFRGLPPLIAFILTVDADLAMRMYNGAFFGKDNVMPSAIIALGSGDPQSQFEQKDIEEVTNQLKNEYSAIKRKTVVTNANTMSFALLGYNNKDMDFLSGMAWNKEEILWAIGVPAGMVDKNSTEANAKVGNKIFKDNMWGVKCLLADEITSQLLMPFYADTLEMRFEDDRVYDRDMELKEAALAKDAMTRKAWAEKYFNVTLKPGEITMSEEKANQQAEIDKQKIGVGLEKEKIKGEKYPGNKNKVTSNTIPGSATSSKSIVELNGVPNYVEDHLPTMLLKDLVSNKSQRTSDQINSLREYIQKNGFTKPVFVEYASDRSIILDGKHRIDIAVELGIEQIPVKVYDEDGHNVDAEIVYRKWLSNGATHLVTSTNQKDTTTENKSIDEELLAIRTKARNYYKLGKIERLSFTSDVIDDMILKNILNDLHGAEQKSDIDFIMDHWQFYKEGNIKGGIGSSAVEGHEFIKSTSWRPWSMFESSLSAKILEALQLVLDLFLGNLSEQMGTDNTLFTQINNILRDKAAPIFQDIASKAAKDVSTTELTISYNLTNIQAREWALQYSATQIKNITDTTQRAVQKTIADWIETGRANGIQGLKDRIRELKGEDGVPLFGEQRADRIAQNEATSVYAGATERSLVDNGYPPTVYKPRAHVNCRCYIQPGRLPSGEKVIVWYTARDEMVCTQELQTPFGVIAGCRNLHKVIISEGHAGEPYITNRKSLKHYGPGPHDNGTDQDVHGGGALNKNDGKYLNELEDELGVPKEIWNIKDEDIKTLWRSMSEYEYHEIMSKGYIQSTGAMSFSTQKDQTFYSSSPSRMYAEDNLRDPVVNMIKESNPEFPSVTSNTKVYIVGVRNSDKFRVNKQREFYTSSPLLSSEITHVVEGFQVGRNVDQSINVKYRIIKKPK